jgi:hypothetical protein
MKTPVIAVASVAAATVLVGIAVPGCSSKSEKSATTSSGSASSTSAATSHAASAQPEAGEPTDYSKLLIRADDIALPSDSFTAAAPTLNPNGKAGVATVFSNGADTREIGDTILILPEAADAATALQGAKSALGSNVTGDPQPAAVGEGGTIVSGPSPDNSKSVTVLLFTEGKAFVTLEFDSKPDDPVPPEFATDIGQKQDAAIKTGLAG